MVCNFKGLNVFGVCADAGCVSSFGLVRRMSSAILSRWAAMGVSGSNIDGFLEYSNSNSNRRKESNPKKYQKQNKKAAIRLNGTTDRDFLYLLGKKAGIVWQELTSLVFYDYTKTLKKAQRYSGTDYVHAFSRSEDNEVQAIQYLKEGGIVAAVFANDLPSHWKGFEVLDGDLRDDLMLEAVNQTTSGKGVVLGLKAKGDAKKDDSGFVITNY